MAAVVDKSNKGENVSMWLLNYIKNHGGPYEIPQECKDSWDLMKIFIADSVFDKKTKESKRKGMVLQGLLSCCLKMAEIVKQKDNDFTEQTDKYETLLKESNEKISELRLHAITTGEALIEKANLCDHLTATNDELSVKIQDIEKELEEHKHAVNIAFDKVGEKSDQLCQNNISKFKEHKQIYPWNELDQASSFPAAPVVTTTVLNTDNSGEVQLISKQLKPQEMDAIVREIGQVPRYDINRFMKWFCELKRVRETYNLNTDDIDRILQRVVGNGLWVRIVQNCGQQRRTRDVFREMLRALYGITLNVSLSGKIKQMKQECPYELCDRIATVMDQLMTGNPGFEHGGLLHRVMLLEALEEDVREGILSVTPDPTDLKDMLLRADNLWRKRSRKESFAVDAARIFRVEGQQNKEYAGFRGPQRGNRAYNSEWQRERGKYEQEKKDRAPRQSWIPFPQLKREHDKLKMEYDTIRAERDLLKLNVSVLEAELSKLRCVSLTTSGVTDQGGGIQHRAINL
nr:Xmc protein [synthetic construct]